MTATATRTRRNGEGSKPRVRADGRYEARYRDLAGSRKSVYADTYDDCARALRDAIHERDVGMPSLNRRATLASWLPTWLEGNRRLRHRSRVRYTAAVAHWLADPIARRRLAELLPEHVSGALSRMDRAGTGVATQAFNLAILRMALDAALRARHVGRNAARLIDAPRAMPRPVEPPRGAELEALETAIMRDRLAALWLLGLDAGLRQGEALALRWRDLDLEAGLIHVRGTLEYGTDRIGPPKSRHSRRTLPVESRRLCEALCAHAGNVLHHPDALVFQTATGHPYHARNVLAWWHELCARAGVRRFRFHDLRHTWATSQLEAGEPLAYVSRYLGHSKVDMTLDTYAQTLSLAAMRGRDR
jgi:integrase